MFFSSQTSRQIKCLFSRLFSILLSLLLLCSLDMTLHVHNLAHSQDNHLEHHHGSDAVGYHSHLGKAHFIHDSSHHEHHHGFILEFDVSPNGLLKSITNNFLTMALLILVFAMLLPAPSSRLVQRHQDSQSILYKYYLLAPPLRAPPQYF